MLDLLEMHDKSSNKRIRNEKKVKEKGHNQRVMRHGTENDK